MLRSRIFFTLLLAVLVAIAAPDVYAVKPRKQKSASRDINRVRTEQQQVKKQLSETSRAISVNMRETERNLNRLNRLGAEMDQSRRNIARISAGIDSLSGAIQLRTDSIRQLEDHIAALKKAYAEALRRAQPYREQMSVMSFIFSSESVTQAYRRVRYLKEFSKWRARRTDELKGAVAELDTRRNALMTVENERRRQLSGLNNEQRNLERQQQETSALVGKLRSEGSELRQILKKREERARALDRELDRLIAEEQARIERERKAAEEAERKRKALAKSKDKDRGASAGKSKSDATAKADPSKDKPALSSTAEADRQLTGSFESNKGRLLFPVAGKYRIVRGFGRQKHPELKHVETNNSGIDIEVAAGTNARAIFQGKVSGVFRLPGYGNVVMVRHGSYISLYANLQECYVKKGDTVKAGQSVGHIYTDPEDDGRTTFHFELRMERNKLNPMEWVR